MKPASLPSLVLAANIVHAGSVMSANERKYRRREVFNWFMAVSEEQILVETTGRTGLSVLRGPCGLDDFGHAGDGDRIVAVAAGFDGRFGVPTFCVAGHGRRREESFVPGDDLARVCRHAAHDGGHRTERSI